MTSATIDPETFKAIMANAPGPATVVTAFDAAGEPHGLTVSAVCSVSLDPPLALACLDLGSNTLAALRESGGFTINYLADGRHQVALGFATKSGAKFEGHSWVAPEGKVGGPILIEHVAAHAACETERLIDAGDHVIAVGRVVEGGAHEVLHAMAYARRQFFTGRDVVIERSEG
ncbi:MAG: flavin reductase family protein [Actinobacteria bacterium]|nr:flavin reductase family protein [Actinomycetota bacterium]